MMYITCEKRKNAPKINVVICEKKCEHAKTCKPYLNFLQTAPHTATLGETAPEGEGIIALKSSVTKERSLVAVGK